MSVRLCIEQHGRRQRTGGAGPDIDDDLLAQNLAGSLAQQPDMHVGHAAGGEGIEDRDRLLGLPSGLPARNDGNNVSMDREARLLSENTLKFNLATQMLRGELKDIRSAIQEGRAQ